MVHDKHWESMLKALDITIDRCIRFHLTEDQTKEAIAETLQLFDRIREGEE